MGEERADDYDYLREALMEKFSISLKIYHQRFRETSVPEGESTLCNLHQLWVRPDLHSKGPFHTEPDTIK